jgi:hypothetical protein
MPEPLVPVKRRSRLTTRPRSMAASEPMGSPANTFMVAPGAIMGTAPATTPVLGANTMMSSKPAPPVSASRPSLKALGVAVGRRFEDYVGVLLVRFDHRLILVIEGLQALGQQVGCPPTGAARR